MSGGRGNYYFYFLYSAGMGIIHAIFNPIPLFVPNKAGIILNTREGFEPWLLYVHKILWDPWVKGIIGSKNWGKIILNIHTEY